MAAYNVAAEQSEDTGMHAESERSCNLPAKFLTISVTQVPAAPCTVLTLPMHTAEHRSD